MDTRTRRRWARRRRLAGVLTVAMIGFGLLTARWFMFPAEDSLDAGSADAVVLFAGGRGERLDHATSLMQAGVAPTLVIMNGRLAGWTRANEQCDEGGLAYQVICPTPDPDTTRGEARLAAELANEEG